MFCHIGRQRQYRRFPYLGANQHGNDNRQAGVPLLAAVQDWLPIKANSASLYIHVPFCASLCDYCDFFSVPANGDSANAGVGGMDLFVDAVLGDVEDQLAFFELGDVPSVYIGGGTPSVLGAARMERLLSGIKNLLDPLGCRPTEFTVEANPESTNEAFLQACMDGGVNRISLGIQTFHEASRRQIGRMGNSDAISRRLALVAERFPNAFSADLIAGLPFQTNAVLAKDIERLLEFQPAHVSLYSLILDPETPLGKRVHADGRAAIFLPTEDEADGLWIAGRDMLENAGLAQYEVSNFALPGKTCMHNIRYWRMENWIGAGPSASGTMIGESGQGRRFTYPDDITSYLAASRPLILFANAEELSKTDLMLETLLMGFRYRKGPDTQSFERRFGCGIADCIPDTIARWRKNGFFETGDPDTLAPSREGLLFVNGFLRDALGEING